MKRIVIFSLLASFLVAGTAFAEERLGHADPITFTTIDGGGWMMVYDLDAQPGFQKSGHLETWRMRVQGSYEITPFLLRQTRGPNYAIAGVGTPRTVTNTLQSFPFDPIVGTAETGPGITFGFFFGTAKKESEGVAAWEGPLTPPVHGTGGPPASWRYVRLAEKTKATYALGAILNTLGPSPRLYQVEFVAGSGPVLPERIDFNRDVRPILSDSCFGCHGPDARKRKAKLRLDTAQGLSKELGEGRRPVVPGKPEQSEIIHRITNPDPDEVMPPPAAPTQLTSRQVAVIGKWIQQGGQWEKHWAFVPPEKVPLPEVQNPAWPRHGIDTFVLHRLEQERLGPSPAASREIWLRRVSLDLTGLPPEPELRKRFLLDNSPMAFEQAVDTLLASPHYGERKAQFWLDAARYADTNGYQDDRVRSQWPWRDWVIDAFNENMPFDQFTIEQLAGDLLPNPTPEQVLATGFNRNHRINTEGGIVDEEFRAEYVMDRVETVAANWLGLTMTCARCHDHKYDPIRQAEYYQLYDFFNNIDENGRDGHIYSIPTMRWVPPRLRTPNYEAVISRVEGTRADLAKHLQAKPPKGPLAKPPTDVAFEADFSSDETVRGTFERGAAVWGDSPLGRACEIKGESFVSFGNKAVNLQPKQPFTLAFWLRLPPRRSASLLNRFVNNGTVEPGYDLFLRDGRAKFRLCSQYILKKGFCVATVDPLPVDQWFHLALRYDGSGSGFGLEFLVNGVPQEMEVEFDFPDGKVAGATLRLGRRIGGPGVQGAGIARVQHFNRELTRSEVAALAAEGVSENGLFPDETLDRLYDEYRTAQKTHFDFEKKHGTAVMVMRETKRPLPTWRLNRGMYDRPDLSSPIHAAVPEVLGKMDPALPSNRLGFARWLVHRDNPLTARVIVNRVWQEHFSVGLVKTSEDFGLQGEWPSHKELLDWLAVDLMENGWDLKRLHKQIVLSATYRQASRNNPDLLERDPANRLLARGPRFRLDANALRDQALAASGLLVPEVGGPSVKPYQTPGIWREISGASYAQQGGKNLYRRSLYTFWKRTVAPPRMSTFDAPTRETCVVRKQRTNTPLQALTLLNDPTYVEAARALAQVMLKQAASPEDRIQLGAQRVLGRNLSGASMGRLATSLQENLEAFQADPKAASTLLAVGSSKASPAFAPAELAAYSITAMVLLNLDTTITRE